MTNDSATRPSDAETLDENEHRSVVRERYARIATDVESCCDDASATACCGGAEASSNRPDADPAAAESADYAHALGYSAADLDAVAPGANLGLGCGNPTALAELDEGDTVLDLGSGAGFDCFIAAQQVGESGHVIGVDMTPAMIEKARENIETNDATNVEFRLGEIEHVPVADESVDVIISNCVVNLSPDKPQVFSEAYRVLRSGGRLAISDVVLTADLPVDLRGDPESLAGCVAGASTISDLETRLADVGFTHIAIEPKEESENFIREWSDEHELSDYIVSATIEAQKPPTT